MYIRTKNVGNYCVEKNKMHVFFLYIFSITVMISKIITEKWMTLYNCCTAYVS
jgi:hypothetical protein